MNVKEESLKEESLQILDFQKLASLMEGNMMVDVTVKIKNDRLPETSMPGNAVTKLNF